MIYSHTQTHTNIHTYTVYTQQTHTHQHTQTHTLTHTLKYFFISTTGTRLIYLYVRRTLGVPFHNGSFALDTGLAKIYDAIQRRHIVDVIIEVFSTQAVQNI